MEQPPPAAPLPLGRYLLLDPLRGLACLSVLAYHASFYLVDGLAASGAQSLLRRVLGYTWAGVPVFFVISGFCIAATADRSLRLGLPVGDFFRRRLRRIFPPYWACLGLAGLLYLALSLAGQRGLFYDQLHPIPQALPLPPRSLMGTLLLMETWRPLVPGLGRGPSAWFLGHAWTLAYEEQFYLVCGLALLVWPRRFFTVAALVTCLCLCLLPLHQRLYGLFLDGHWLGFAEGVFVYRVLNYGGQRERLGLALLLSAGLAAAWVAVARVGDHDFARHLCFTALTALFLLAVAPYDRALARVQWLSPLRWCGLRCYSIYLLHWPVTKVVSHAAWALGLHSSAATLGVTLPLCYALSLGCAAIFFRRVESRFLARA